MSDSKYYRATRPWNAPGLFGYEEEPTEADIQQRAGRRRAYHTKADSPEQIAACLQCTRKKCNDCIGHGVKEKSKQPAAARMNLLRPKVEAMLDAGLNAKAAAARLGVSYDRVRRIYLMIKEERAK